MIGGKVAELDKEMTDRIYGLLSDALVAKSF